MSKPGRNDLCPCGSGKKYKHCCQAKEQAHAATVLASTACAHKCSLGLGLLRAKRLDDAVQCFQQALVIKPDSPEAYFNLGDTFMALSQFALALESYQKGLLIKPDLVAALCNMAIALQSLGRLDEAVAISRHALMIDPTVAAAHTNLGMALQAQGNFGQAIDSYRQVLLLQPSEADAWYNLATALGAQDQLDESVASYRRALELKPDYVSAYSNMLFTLQNVNTITPAALFSEHQRFAERFESPLKLSWKSHPNSRDTKRRIKVGYVSADFRRHSVACFIEPILSCHDKTCFEIFGYYNHNLNDSHTELIASYMDHFLTCANLTDVQLAERIRADAIDILVDLSGHTALNRLPVFARKPAPVQATYIGYPGTTGLSAIDYRISDPWQDPPGLTERYHSETLVRIPGGMAFAPEPDAPEVNALPALTSGGLTLACLNNLSKLNPAVVHLWARILSALPQARLMLGNVINSGIQTRLLALFNQAGIEPERLILQPRVSVTEYLTMHHQIDLALDPFPYNGGTITMYSLWMGVPVITLAGDHAVSRLSAAHLARVGLDEFITHSEDEYVQCAVKFANNLPRLNEVRQSLRARMNAPECQPAAITRQLEAAYRDMWQKWCNQ